MVKRYRKPHQFKKIKPIYRNRFFWLGILILIFFSSIFYFLFFAEFFQIKKINIAGLEQVSEEQLNLLVIEKLENKILFFSSGTIFWVNLNKIKEAILEKFPQIDKIEISRNFPNNLDVLVTERKGLATFCHEEKCFILDKEGIVFDPIRNDISNEARENQLLIKIIDKSETEPYNLGKRVIEKEDFIKERCFICKNPAKGYVHQECALALDELKKKRIEKLIEKYGEGTRFVNVLLNDKDLK